jgi:hypothetical protein
MLYFCATLRRWRASRHVFNTIANRHFSRLGLRESEPAHRAGYHSLFGWCFAGQLLERLVRKDFLRFCDSCGQVATGGDAKRNSHALNLHKREDWRARAYVSCEVFRSSSR